MLDLLFSPDRFFRERAEHPGLRGPLLVVTVVAVLGAVAAYPASQAIADALPAEAQGFGGITVAITVTTSFAGPFAVWALIAGAFHGLSAVLYDGEGSFRNTLSLTGWGFVPAILTALVNAVVAFLVWPSVSLDFSDPQRAQEAAAAIQQRPEFVVASVVGLVVLLWRGMLWTFAIQHGRKLSFREALIVVGVPVVLLFVWRAWGLVGVF